MNESGNFWLWGETVSVSVTEALVRGMTQFLGQGNTSAAFTWIVKQLYPELSCTTVTPEEAGYLNPLWPYWGSRFGSRQPVDYLFFFWLRKFWDVAYKGHPEVMKQFGEAWWLGYSSQSPGLPDPSVLQFMFLPALRCVLPAISSEHTDWLQPLCQTFASEWVQETGIGCTAASQGERSRLFFPVCPFCFNARPDCYVLFGVVKAVMQWVQDEQRMEGRRIDVSIEHDDSHDIMISLLQEDQK